MKLLIIASCLVVVAACGADAGVTPDASVAVVNADVAVAELAQSDHDGLPMFETQSADAIPGTFGAPCASPDDCDSNVCIEGPNGKMCTQLCQENCPQEFNCSQTTGRDAIFVCLPNKLPEKCNGSDDDKDGMTDEGFCDDGNSCTIDGCDPGGNCLHKERDAQPCDDGSACTLVDKCFGSKCKGANPLECKDNDPCTKDNVCDAVAGCKYPPQAGPCNDGNVCTIEDTCLDGACTISKPRPCNDTNPCTYDSCDPAKNPKSGCLFAPIPDGPAPAVGTDKAKACPPTLPYCNKGQCAQK